MEVRVYTTPLVNVRVTSNVNNFTAEKRFDRRQTIADLKGCLELVTGGSAQNMTLEVFDEAERLVCQLTNDNVLLGSYCVEENYRIHVTDSSKRQGEFGDLLEVEKHELLEDECNKRNDSVQSSLLKSKLGKYNEEETKKRQEEKAKLNKAKSILSGSRCEVRVQGEPTRRGEVMFVEKVHYKGGVWLGVKYDEPVGKKDGRSQGRSPRVPAGPAVMCAAVEAVRLDCSMNSIEQSKFECQQCGKTFMSQSHLERHSLKHSDAKNYECELCGKRFAWKFRLTRHNLVHSGYVNYECQQCGKRFTREGELIRHTRIHGAKSHECQECGKRFIEKSTLTTHTLIHSGVKNYECQECGKRFALKSGLTKHTLTHSGVKNHECQECGKRFTTTSSLNKHILRHTGLREFKCDVCGKCFKTKSEIVSHMRIHF